MNRSQQYIEQGDKLLNEDKLEDAIECYQQAIAYVHKDEPKSTLAVRLYHKLGRVYSMNNKYVEARECFDAAQSLQEQPTDECDVRETAENIQDLGYFYRKAGDYCRAKDCYHKALNLLKKHLGLHDPQTERACYLLGLTYLENEEEDEALYYLQKPCPLGWLEDD